MKGLGKFIGGVAAGVGIGAVAVVAVLREQRRKSEVEVLGAVITDTITRITESFGRVMAPPPDIHYDLPERDIPGLAAVVTPEGIFKPQAKEPVPWYLQTSQGVDDTADNDPIDLDAPLDSVVPMQPGSIGPIIEGGVFAEPMPEGDWEQDRRGPRTVSMPPGSQPFRDIGLTSPDIDIMGSGD